MAELKVKVDRVFYPPPDKENEFKIISTDKGVIKGKLSWRPEKGELLALEGKYGTYQGKSEFQFTSARADVPIDARDQLRYVCEVTEGFGVAMETKIWDAWGDEWIEKIKPGIVKGLKGAKFDALLNSVDQLQLKRDECEAVAWMMSIGATVNLAQAAWNRWEKQAIGVVKASCYSLAELPNYGFVNVDRSIRFAFGIQDGDPRRIKSGILYAIKQMTDNGSTLVNWYMLKNQIDQVLGCIGPELVNQVCRQMFEDGVLVPYKDTLDIAHANDEENAEIIWSYVNR